MLKKFLLIMLVIIIIPPLKKKNRNYAVFLPSLLLYISFEIIQKIMQPFDSKKFKIFFWKTKLTVKISSCF
ncbi:hypothetical protein C0971_04520 [Bacillus methanolicus]|nr:hypothetical protein C0971_04520 [Bacillus methanolicus]